MSARKPCRLGFLHVEDDHVVTLERIIAASRHHVVVRQFFLSGGTTRCSSSGWRRLMAHAER